MSAPPPLIEGICVVELAFPRAAAPASARSYRRRIHARL